MGDYKDPPTDTTADPIGDMERDARLVEGSPAIAGPLGAGNSSPIVGELMSALAKAQGEMLSVVKDAENPHFRSKYATLAAAIAAARPALSKYGIALIQTCELGPEGTGLLECATVIACGEQWIRSVVSVPIAKRDAQAIGSAASYGRRYGLLAMLGLAPEDDDGNAATQRGPEAVRRQMGTKR